MNGLNRIIMFFLLVGLIYALYCYQKRSSKLDLLEREVDIDSNKIKKKHKKKKLKLKKRNEVKKKKKTYKKKIDLIEIDELDQLSFEDLNSNITLGTLENSRDEDPVLDILTTETDSIDDEKLVKKKRKNKNKVAY